MQRYTTAVLASTIVSGLLATSPVTAQQDSAESGADATDNIVVYGLRLSQPETEVGSSVSILTADDIEALSVDYALDAIASMPGVTVNQNGPFGGSASVRIRGAASEQTLVIVDGVVFNDPTSPGGGFNFARLDPANIERIEVLKGPQSTLWGTDAIGGVVNIVTKRPDEEFSGRAFAQAGSFNSLRGGLEIGTTGEVFDLRFGVSHNESDGISKADEINGNVEDDGYVATTLHSSVGARLFGDATAELTVLWTDAENDFDSFSFGDQGNVADGNEVSTTEELISNLSIHIPLLDGRLDNMFLVGYNDIDRENFSDGASSFASEGDRKTFRYQGDLTINDDNRLAFGIEREENESNGEENSIDGLFALYELQPIDTLTLTAGVRRDDHEIYGGETTSRFAAAYNPTELITLRASWGEGFKAPTLFQTTFFCCGAVAPNADLRPEVSDAFDVGVVWRTADARGEFGVTYFDQDTIDLINFSFAVGGYENIAEARSNGFEVSAAYQFSDWLGASINFADIDAKDGTGTALVRVPEQSGDLMVSFTPIGDFSGNIVLRYNGEEQDANGVVPSWSRVDLSGRYQLNDAVEIYARVENAFDKQYQQIIGYGTPGRSGYLGARFSF